MNQSEIEKSIKVRYTQTNQERIDLFLSNLEEEELISRSFIDKLIRSGLVRVNGHEIKKSYKLTNGDQIEIQIPKRKDAEVLPQNLPLDVLYEDEFLAIINKQAGISVHPGAGMEDGTLVNALMHHLKCNLSRGSNPLRPGIVHRLDKDTSGLLITVKDDKTHALLSRMFLEKEIEKTYLAIVCGVPSEKYGTIETCIERSKTDRKKMAVSQNGRTAITHYKVLRDYHFFSTIEIALETGRTHQIRVHFSHLNCPVLGDRVYNSLKRTLSLTNVQFHKKIKYLLANHLHRQALHASRLEFIHPITRQKMRFAAPLPEDIKYTLSWLERNFGE